MNTTSKSITALGGLIAVVLAGVVLAPTAQAADSAATGTVIAAAPSSTRAAATVPNGISISGHGGKPVTLLAKGAAPMTKSAPAAKPVVFTHLQAGRSYEVRIGGKLIGTATPVSAVGAASDLVVTATDQVGAVSLTWRQEARRGTGAITYVATATAAGAPTITASLEDPKGSTLTGLRDDVLYTFTVTPRNSASKGRATKATMTRTLKDVRGERVPTRVEAPKPSAQGAQSAPTASSPRTLPYTYSTLPYTYHVVTTTKPYTYHDEATGPAPLLDAFETKGACPAGYNLEDYGVQGTWCKLYGPVPTKKVKDAPPAGYTDNGTAYERSEQVRDAAPAGYSDTGTEWRRKDAPPAGFMDDGSQYIEIR